jgi:hypothetical protein
VGRPLSTIPPKSWRVLSIFNLRKRRTPKTG